jgi:hypothetical protein
MSDLTMASGSCLQTRMSPYTDNIFTMTGGEMKRTIPWVLLFVTVLVLLLYLTTLISTAHRQGRATIEQSALVKSSVGRVDHAFLTLFSQKTGPSGQGCTKLTYFVIGANGTRWTNVLLRKENNRSEWYVIELATGAGYRFRASCTPG